MVLSFRRRQDTWQRLHGKPARERHFTSMVCSIAAVISLAVAVGLPWWAIGNSTSTTSNEKKSCYFEFGLVTIRVMSDQGTTTYSLSAFYSVLQQVIVACILCLVACTFVLQCIAGIVSAGYPRERFEFLRHFSVFNIVSLICVVTSGGFWLWVCELFPRRTTDVDNNSIYKGELGTLCGQVSFPEVTFHAGFYVCTLSGIFCLIALSINMICSRTAADRRRRERQRLRHRERNFDAFLSRNVTEMQARTNHSSSNPEPSPPPPPPPPSSPPPLPPELSDTDGYTTSEGEMTDVENPPPYAP